MIGYTTIGVSDIDRACNFYDGLLAEIGAKQLFGQDRIKFYLQNGYIKLPNPRCQRIM